MSASLQIYGDMSSSPLDEQEYGQLDSIESNLPDGFISSGDDDRKSSFPSTIENTLADEDLISENDKHATNSNGLMDVDSEMAITESLSKKNDLLNNLSDDSDGINAMKQETSNVENEKGSEDISEEDESMEGNSNKKGKQEEEVLVNKEKEEKETEEKEVEKSTEMENKSHDILQEESDESGERVEQEGEEEKEKENGVSIQQEGVDEKQEQEGVEQERKPLPSDNEHSSFNHTSAYPITTSRNVLSLRKNGLTNNFSKMKKKHSFRDHLTLHEKPKPKNTYNGLDYPPDHMHDMYFTRKTQFLKEEENNVIRRLAIKRPYRSAFYSSYLSQNSYVYTSKGMKTHVFNPSHLIKLNNAVMKGVRSNYTICDGCAMQPIDVSTSRRLIRKFIGNKEVRVIQSRMY